MDRVSWLYPGANVWINVCTNSGKPNWSFIIFPTTSHHRELLLWSRTNSEHFDDKAPSQQPGIISVIMNSATRGHRSSAHIILPADALPLPWAKSFMTSACWRIDFVFFIARVCALGCLHKLSLKHSKDRAVADKQEAMDCFWFLGLSLKDGLLFDF